MCVKGLVFQPFFVFYNIFLIFLTDRENESRKMEYIEYEKRVSQEKKNKDLWLMMEKKRLYRMMNYGI
jgi:hypothetical protein